MTVKWLEFPIRGDDRGQLVALEELRNLPIAVKRVYYIYGTLAGVRRGLHAHKKLRQVAIAVAGSCKMLFDDGQTKEILTLDRRDRGLVIDPLVWHEMFDFSPDCVLMVLAEEYYDESDYIRIYDKFKELQKRV